MHYTQLYLGDNLQKIIDLDKVVKMIDDSNISILVAFNNNKPAQAINNDLNSIKNALNNYTKIFLGFGFIYYVNEPYFVIETYDIKNSDTQTITFKDKETKVLLIKSKIIHNLNDEYYDKYKYPVEGYGIYLDKDLNVEYGYYTIEDPASDYGTNSITFHDFKDAIDGDLVKETIFSSLNHADIWKTDDVILVEEGYDKEVSLLKLVNLKTDILCFINDKCFDIKQEDDILKELNKERTNYWRPIYGIIHMVLNNDGKLYFKLTNDEGIFVIRKNNDKYVSQVGKYSADEGEILLDKESDEDIYINTHVFKPKFTSISDVNLALKDKKINLDKTMERVSMPDFYNGPTVEVECDGIYIHTVYASERSVADEIYEYELDDNDFITVGIDSGLGNCDLRLSPQYYTGDEAGDYGIEVFDDGTIWLSKNTSGIFGGVREINDLSEPLNAFVIEILMNTLVFEDSLSDEDVMYCPDCGEDYHNDEELCPECGTKLVTEFEITMLEYKGEL